MGKKNLDWSNLPFSYMKTDKRFVANFKDGKWDDGKLIKKDKVCITECAGVLQYAQTCFEGLKSIYNSRWKNRNFPSGLECGTYGKIHVKDLKCRFSKRTFYSSLF